VAYILIFHSLGLIFFVLLMLLNRIFYAFKNVRTPLKVASFSIIANFILDWVLIKFMGVGGLALSTSMVALLNVVILIIILRKKVGNFGGRRIFVSYGKIFISATIMGVVLYFSWKLLESFAYQGLWPLILLLFLTIVVCIGIYIVCTIMFKMEEAKFAIGLFKRLKKNT